MGQYYRTCILCRDDVSAAFKSEALVLAPTLRSTDSRLRPPCQKTKARYLGGGGPNTGGTFGGVRNKDCNISGSMLGSPM